MRRQETQSLLMRHASVTELCSSAFMDNCPEQDEMTVTNESIVQSRTRLSVAPRMSDTPAQSPQALRKARLESLASAGASVQGKTPEKGTMRSQGLWQWLGLVR
jgi:hypothetical protein